MRHGAEDGALGECGRIAWTDKWVFAFNGSAATGREVGSGFN